MPLSSLQELHTASRFKYANQIFWAGWLVEIATAEKISVIADSPKVNPSTSTAQNGRKSLTIETSPTPEILKKFKACGVNKKSLSEVTRLQPFCFSYHL
jgi:hypothetical protein